MIKKHKWETLEEVLQNLPKSKKKTYLSCTDKKKDRGFYLQAQTIKKLENYEHLYNVSKTVLAEVFLFLLYERIQQVTKKERSYFMYKRAINLALTQDTKHAKTKVIKYIKMIKEEIL